MLFLEVAFIIHSYITASVALLVNGALMYAVCTRTPPELKAYGALIFNIVLSDFLVALFNLWLQPLPASSANEIYRPEGDSGISYVIMGPVVYFIHPHTNHGLTCIFIGLILYSVLTVPISFVARYLLICHPELCSKFQKGPSHLIKPLVGLILLINSAVVAVIMYLGDMPHEETAYQQVAPIVDWSEYYTHYEDDPEQPLFGNLIHLDFHAIIASAIFLSNVFISYVVLVICATCIIRKFREMQHSSTMSPKTLNIQKRLTYCLISQSFLPILCGGLPLTLISVTIGFQMYSQLISSLAMGVHSYLQIGTPLLTMFFMPSYRFGARKNAPQTPLKNWMAARARRFTLKSPLPVRLSKKTQPAQSQESASCTEQPKIVPKIRAKSAALSSRTL